MKLENLPRALALAGLVLAYAASGSLAQDDSASPAVDSLALAIPEPDPADVESIDAILTAVYDVISGPADEIRDWNRFRSLFAEGARLIPTAVTPGGGVNMAVMTPEEYAMRAAAFFQQPGGFFEKEIGRKVDEYGNIAQVFSAYASFREGEDEPFMRGINSFQLVKRDGKWSIVTIFWDAEREENPIPAELTQ